MKRTSHRLLALLLGASTALAVGTYASAQTFVPVTDAALSNPDPNDWLMASRTYDEHRFSPLNQIEIGRAHV